MKLKKIMEKLRIGENIISKDSKTYFIADIAANHDGKLSRAKKLIFSAAKAGADAAKFQNFFAKNFISDFGFKKLGGKKSHQSKWKKSVYDIYKKAELPIKWTVELKKTCKKTGIDYLTAPYDLGIIKYLNKHVAAWKVGSGDITFHKNIISLAKTNKTIIISTGASNLEEVEKIYRKVVKINKKIIIMQCNTNYTADKKNFSFINLHVLKKYKKLFPKAILCLSDHTHGDETVLGAVALGARVIEKHFTDNNNRVGPDHKFSMNPIAWKKMVLSTRNLEMALGDGRKKIEKNEKETVILQRRSIRVNKSFKKGEKINTNNISFLRPCPKNAIPPYMLEYFLNKKLIKNIKKDDYLKKIHFSK